VCHGTSKLWTSIRQNNVGRHHPGKWGAVRESPPRLSTKYHVRICLHDRNCNSDHSHVVTRVSDAGPRSTNMYLHKDHTSTERGPNKVPRKPPKGIPALLSDRERSTALRSRIRRTANSLVHEAREASPALYRNPFPALILKTSR